MADYRTIDRRMRDERKAPLQREAYPAIIVNAKRVNVLNEEECRQIVILTPDPTERRRIFDKIAERLREGGE